MPINPAPQPTLSKEVGKTLGRYRDLVIFVLGGTFATVIWALAAVIR